MNDLEQLLMNVAADADQEPAFTAALLASEVVVLGEVEGEQLAIGSWSDEDGDVIPFFTSDEMVRASAQQMPGLEPAVFSLPCRDLWQFSAGSRLVLNPHGPVARIYQPPEIAGLLAGLGPGDGLPVDYDDLGLEVSVPSPEPVALHQALRELLTPRENVHGAHLGWVRRSDGTEGYLLFVLTDDVQSAFAGVEDLDLASLLGGHDLDVTAIPPGTDDHLLAEVPPLLAR